MKGEPLRFPLCVILGHRAPRCMEQVLPSQQKRRPKASFLLAEMEGFELWLGFLLCPKCTVNFVQTVPCFIEHRLADVGIAISYGI